MADFRASGLDYLKSWPLYVLPQHAISRLVYRLTRIKSARATPVIRWFIRQFKVNMDEAANPDPASYESFNAFFTRALKAGVRPLASGKSNMLSPVDGAISQFGRINSGRIFQAKGHEYNVVELLGGDHERARPFVNGQFITLYLSPRDYHRIHMPVSGELCEQIHVPGRLFSVAPHTTRTIPRLFARNERVIAIFDTEYGALAMVLVGAINVAAIETVWEGLVTPPAGKSVSCKTYEVGKVRLAKGDEMGRFNMGSTVILLSTNKDLKWHKDLQADVSVKMGQLFAHF